jgi:thiol-disulfide isomerase/thioredoxin
MEMIKMKPLIIALLFNFMLIATSAQIPVMDFKEFEPYLQRANDTTYVINFWATWCKPCVEEIPAFEELSRNYSHLPVKVLMVSLDFVRNLNSHLIPFIKNHNMIADVILLNDPRSHIWIEKVDGQWSGAIPATLIYNDRKRSFYERTFKFEELEQELLKHLQLN